MTIAVTTRKGVVAEKLGIGPCSFSSRDCAGDDNEVPAGDGHDLDHAPSRYFGIGGRGQVVRGAPQADAEPFQKHGPEPDPHTAASIAHLFPPDSVTLPRP